MSYRGCTISYTHDERDEPLPPARFSLAFFQLFGVLNASRMDQVSFQWYLGPPGSGANDHYHGHAYNALLHGAKRWFLTPPPYAWYSRCETRTLFVVS